jgi:hypothetical protein
MPLQQSPALLMHEPQSGATGGGAAAAAAAGNNRKDKARFDIRHCQPKYNDEQ